MSVALLIIDQQQGIDHPKWGPRNNPQAGDVILAVLASWRERDWPVFHIVHRSAEPDSVFWPGQAGYELKAAFQALKGEYLIEKSVPCAFVNNSIEQQLNDLNVESIVIVGAATNNSVESTARTAGNLGFKVTILEDACFCFDKADYFGSKRSAREVHAMSLANLHDEYATVMHSNTYLTKFS
ncbi:MAG: cysteine hydrolase [Oceanospirillaceae bacterium]|nr:cysteine hydrolase [Oceanospirillaceae bacterium]